ncbi:hypothetical protein KP509_1Z042100 [Ceratopteris richardii]|nr:hypothetical protein KP509_1Z042100 [Ceratopteris richardii]
MADQFTESPPLNDGTPFMGYREGMASMLSDFDSSMKDNDLFRNMTILPRQTEVIRHRTDKNFAAPRITRQNEKENEVGDLTCSGGNVTPAGLIDHSSSYASHDFAENDRETGFDKVSVECARHQDGALCSRNIIKAADDTAMKPRHKATKDLRQGVGMRLHEMSLALALGEDKSLRQKRYADLEVKSWSEDGDQEQSEEQLNQKISESGDGSINESCTRTYTLMVQKFWNAETLKLEPLEEENDSFRSMEFRKDAPTQEDGGSPVNPRSFRYEAVHISYKHERCRRMLQEEHKDVSTVKVKLRSWSFMNWKNAPSGASARSGSRLGLLRRWDSESTMGTGQAIRRRHEYRQKVHKAGWRKQQPSWLLSILLWPVAKVKDRYENCMIGSVGNRNLAGLA